MDYAFEELIDPSLLQRLGDEVHQTLGVSAGILNADNKLVRHPHGDWKSSSISLFFSD